MLSRKKPAVGPGSGNTVSSAKDSKKKRKLPKLDDFLQMRDYTGASTLLEVLSVVILVLQGKWCFYYLGQGKGGWVFLGELQSILENSSKKICILVGLGLCIYYN